MSDTILQNAKQGFSQLTIDELYKEQALKHLEEWLTDEQFAAYVPQIKHLIDSKQWEYLLDSFYQIVPFGTAGRRGEVGIGPNRINPITIRLSAQGHAQYLLKNYAKSAEKRGVVLAYDGREFTETSRFNSELPNPVAGIKSRDLAQYAAEVYAGNGIKTYIFDDVRTTPELSFAVRHLKTVGGNVFSASHNPPSHNGKKVYDEFGGQLAPPHDEALINEVTQNVTSVQSIAFDQATNEGLIVIIGKDVDEAYIQATSKLSLSTARDIIIAFTPLHGAGTTSISKTLTALGFTVHEDPSTNTVSGRFENITFQIPNPEVVQSFDTSLNYAKSIDADILLSSDPDADRIGVMVRHHDDWVFLTGNEIAILLAKYAATHKTTPGTGIIVKSMVTTDALKSICERHNIRLVGDLLIGFKYIAEIMNELERAGDIDNFLLGAEESHGYLSGNYARDKDATVGALWLSELAAELKAEQKTLIDYLDDIYIENGYFKNYLTEIRMSGATGIEQIRRIQSQLRKSTPTTFGSFAIRESVDYQALGTIVSESDRVSKDILVFYLESGSDEIASIKVTIRPSGTEPKIKIYFEIGFHPAASKDELERLKTSSGHLIFKIEKVVLLEMYKSIGIDFPERGFLLFWQLPLDHKMRYFEAEPLIENLKSLQDAETKRRELTSLLSFLGSNPTQKVNDAFRAAYGATIEEYLEI